MISDAEGGGSACGPGLARGGGAHVAAASGITGWRVAGVSNLDYCPEQYANNRADVSH